MVEQPVSYTSSLNKMTGQKWRSILHLVKEWVSPYIGLPFILAANYVLRKYLEQADTRINSFLDYAYPDAVRQIFTVYPWWRLFLPLEELTGSWSTTTLILTHLIERILSAPTTWYLFNGLLIIVSFVTSWFVFRSWVFSYTFCICMGFGTQLYHTYAVTGTVSSYLLFIYYELLLFCGYKVLQSEKHRNIWKLFFILSLIITALAYESWLDYLVFAWLASLYLLVTFWRTGQKHRLPNLAFIAASMTLVALLYVYIKTQYGYGQVEGSESDVVFNYPHLAPAVEDVISNVFTHFYLVVTNFLPPFLVSSNSLYLLGPEKLIEYQGGYHSQFSELVPMHHLFLWRYYAGVLFAVFAYFLVKVILKSQKSDSPTYLALSIFMIMAATGGPTHDFIKFRPMNSAPVLGYHVMVGVLGMSLLISYLLLLARRNIQNSYFSSLIILLSWSVILYSALARPAYLGHLAEQVGLGKDIYPDPLKSLMAIVTLTPQSAKTPPELEPFKAAPGELLFKPLPDLTRWSTDVGVQISLDNDSFLVEGNDAQFNYQIVSPPISIQPQRQIILRWQSKVEQGKVCLGVLDQTSQGWLVLPTETKEEYLFNSGDNQAMQVVVANCNSDSTGNESSQFIIYSGSYAVVGNEP